MLTNVGHMYMAYEFHAICICVAYVEKSQFVTHLAGLYIGCGYGGMYGGWVGVCSTLVNNLQSSTYVYTS